MKREPLPAENRGAGAGHHHQGRHRLAIAGDDPAGSGNT